MSVTPGTRLGPYEILGPIGAGGMGEVYRARDARLGRDVAVKVLPDSVARDPRALARFESEAQAVAALSHPNILAIFDVGRHGETAYAVMELLEGETLRARLEQGALPARKAIDLAAQIAEGLAAAHEKGIVHRDVKPENVFVTQNGHAKVLDFGLAKRTDPAADANLATVEQLTEPGAVVGTVRYMSPEQVRGEAVDHRSDIFAFGAVLYEMLTGRPAFKRDTAAETMTAILREDPPSIAPTDSGPSPALQRLVQHCLEKKPGERFQSARDIAFNLHALSGSDVMSGPVPAVAPGRRRMWMMLAGTVGVAAAVGVAAMVSYQRGQQTGVRSAAETRFLRMTFSAQPIFQAAFMPDGQTIVYSAAPEGNVPELFVVRPESPTPEPLGLPRTHLLSISSTGELAVLTEARYFDFRLFVGTLARMKLGGGAPREVLEHVRQADWSPDGSQLAIIRAAEGKDRLEFPIGTVLYEAAGYLSDLRVSPRGDQLALYEHPRVGDDRGSLIVVNRAGTRTVLSGEYWAEQGLSWSRTGDEILFTASPDGSDPTLYAVDLSGRRRVVLRSAGGLTLHDVSREGRWLVTRDDQRAEISALAPGTGTERDLTWLDRCAGPVLSRDGRLVLFSDQSIPAGRNYAVCLRTTDGGPIKHLGEGSPMAFSPDARWALAIVFTPPQLVIYPTGPGETRILPRGNLETYQWADWYPDGNRVLVCGNEAGKARRCYEQDIVGGLPRPVTPEGTTNGKVSPDGRRIVAGVPGGPWIIQPAEGGQARPVQAIEGHDEVVGWSGDGRALVLFAGRTYPYRFERLDLASGRREPLREVSPANRTGIRSLFKGTMSDDATSYAYAIDRMTSQLFLVEGAR